MQGLYEKFSKHSKTLEDHHDRMRRTSTTLEQVTSCKKHIKERPNVLRILYKLERKTTEVSIETWEAMCDSVEAVVNAGQEVCENMWFASKNFLTYLSLHVLEPLSEALCPKVHLEEVEKQFDDSKELIQQISQSTMQEIEKWIEFPHASIACTKLFIKEWKKKDEEAKHQLRNAEFVNQQ